jgi:hypothetical protein
MSTIVNKIQFKNGHSYETISVMATGSQYIQGMSRPTIDVQFADGLFNVIQTEVAISGNTDTLTIQNCAKADDGTITVNTSYVHNNYDIIQHIGIDRYVVSTVTDTTAEVDENRTSLLLGQLTYLEVTQKSQQTSINALIAASLEG